MHVSLVSVTVDFTIYKGGQETPQNWICTTCFPLLILHCNRDKLPYKCTMVLVSFTLILIVTIILAFQITVTISKCRCNILDR